MAVVGAALWGSASLLDPPTQAGTVEVRPLQESSWSVEVKEVADADVAARTAAVVR
jgi:hypothetical protein